MKNIIHSGYSNIFRPPYEVDRSKNKSTIYCVSDEFNNFLVMIPLVPSFFEDAINIARKVPTKNIYLVVSDMGILFISDYYQTFDYLTNQLGLNVTVVTKYKPEFKAPETFLSKIVKVDDSYTIALIGDTTSEGSVVISFVEDEMLTGSPYACDIKLQDTISTKLFAVEMNTAKANYYYTNKDLCDEIHMQFITGCYGGMSYFNLMRAQPSLINKVYCNQFASTEEYAYAIGAGIKLGGVFKP